MALALVRIDDRLIHGQVVEGWLPVLRASRILVVSDQAAQDATQQALMRLALPESVALEVVAVADGPEAVLRAQAARERVLVLVPGPREALALLEGEVQLSAINVGGLHYAAGRVQLGRAIFLGDDEVTALKAIRGRGVRLDGRAVPSEASYDVLGAAGV